MGTLTILDPGPFASIQDAGRPGLAHEGISPSGAADRPAATLANRLVGSPEEAPVIEVTLGGLRFVASRAISFAVTGAPCEVLVGARRDGSHAVLQAAAGDEIRLRVPPRGLRSYVAVAGGLVVPRLLGSASEDTLSSIAPLPLTAGTVVPLGRPPVTLGDQRLSPAPVPPLRADAVLAVEPGPRADWMTDASWARLVASTFTVAPDSNRVGVRLGGVALERTDARELPSEGIVPGAIQLPPSGELVCFLADHPTTGGYPVVAVVAPASMPTLAQLRPGDTVRLVRAR